jgi:hypothetical protein
MDPSAFGQDGSATAAQTSSNSSEADEGFVSFSARKLSSILLQTTEQLNSQDGLAGGNMESGNGVPGDDLPIQKGSAVEAARAREAKRIKLQTEIEVMLACCARASIASTNSASFFWTGLAQQTCCSGNKVRGEEGRETKVERDFPQKEIDDGRTSSQSDSHRPGHNR